MNAHRFLIAICAAVVLVASTLAVSASTSAAPTSFTKKRCHIVKKKVHGKIKRVRVCTKPKPKPKPKPTAKNVSLSLDQSRRATATIGAAGGTVSTSAATGARLTLSVPAGVLDDATAISVTPVSKLNGARGIKLLAGAELGPEGLTLAEAATLTLELPRSGAKAFGIAWFGTGQNVHRYPVARSGSRFTIRLSHFSGAGVGTGDAEWLPSVETALTVAYARQVRPLMRRAERDDTVFEEAVSIGFRWLKNVEIVGLSERFRTWRAEVVDSMQKIFTNALERASERCAAHDLTQLGRLARIDKVAQGAGFDTLGSTISERIERCARFELVFDTADSVTTNSGGAWENHVRGVVSIRLEETGFRGSGPLESLSLTLRGCTAGPATADGPIVVDRMTIQLPGPNTPPDVFVLMRPPIVHATLVCGGQSVPAPGYYAVWFPFHRDEFSNGFYGIGNWQWVGGEVVARKTYDRTQAIDGGTTTEHTTLTLRHSPAS